VDQCPTWWPPCRI